MCVRRCVCFTNDNATKAESSLNYLFAYKYFNTGAKANASVHAYMLKQTKTHTHTHTSAHTHTLVKTFACYWNKLCLLRPQYKCVKRRAAVSGARWAGELETAVFCGGLHGCTSVIEIVCQPTCGMCGEPERERERGSEHRLNMFSIKQKEIHLSQK